VIVKIRKAKSRDIRKLSGRLREADAQELLAAGNASVESALVYSFKNSTVRRTVEIDGVPVGLFGLHPQTLLGDEACIWFLGTPELARIKKTFVKLSRQVIVKFLSSYPILWNVVDVRYVSAIRWLESCGAVFDEGSAIPGFRRFSIRRA
jgi:hypothetical protein